VRIAVVTRRYWPAVGGIERVAQELARALCAAGHEVFIVAQRTDEGPATWLTHTVREAPAFASFEHEGASVRQFRLSAARRIALLPLAHEAIPRVPRITAGKTRLATAPLYERVAAPALAPLLDGSDVVHVLGGAWISVAAVPAARRLGLPVAVTPFVHRGFWRDDPASVRSYLQADAVLATVEHDAADLRALGVPAELISVCGLPVSAVARRPGNAERLVLFVGARVGHKGVGILRRAARLVWEHEPDVRFAYVGSGPSLDDPDSRELDVGPVSDEERGDWFSRAAVLCLPSASESFGLVVAEAWSAGKPVVTSRIGVLRELVEGARGGLAVEREPHAVADALLRLLQRPAEAGELGRAGREYWNANFRPERVAARHLELYARIGAA